MDWFALDETVAQMEATLQSQQGLDRLPDLLALAWALRQRDCRRALLLADEAEALLSALDPDQEAAQLARARLQLLSAEISWLYGHIDATEHLAESALNVFETFGHRCGAGDARLSLTSVWLERGNIALRDEFIALTIEDYRACGDRLRLMAAQARSLALHAFHQPRATAEALNQLFDEGRAPADPTADAAMLTWLASTRAIVASLTGSPGGASRYFIQSYNAALSSGQLRHAIYAACNAGDALATLGDLDAAMDWGERGLTLARRCDWPPTTGLALMQVGKVQRMLGRFADARESLNEALAQLEQAPGSQGHVLTQLYLGDLAIDMGVPATALVHFCRAEDRAAPVGNVSQLMGAWSGQALALCRLGQPNEALAKAGAALALAHEQGSTDEQIKNLRIHAELYQSYALPKPADLSASSPVLHYLEQALRVASEIDGYVIPCGLLEELSSAYAAHGNATSAQSYGQAAAQARASKKLDDARNRAETMSIRQDGERAKAEAESQRRHAEAEALRAQALQETTATLEVLSQIGLELTSNLNQEEVFATFYRHIQQLMDVGSFFVYLLDEQKQQLHAAFDGSAGKAGDTSAGPRRIALLEPKSYTALCARSRQELILGAGANLRRPNPLQGPQDNASMLFMPLLIGERLLGVLSVQSRQADAYGERELAICRTLCSYGSIALDNAKAYALADRAQKQATAALNDLELARAKLAQRADTLAEEVSKATSVILQRERETVIRLSKAAEYRDPETGAHILRMAHYSELIARGLGLSKADQQLLLEAAPMHDIGKVGISDSVLLKPGRLTPEEFEIMKGHARIGHEILKDSSSLVLQTGAAIALGHHEKFDGSGYPQGLVGDQIPIFSRIVAVADVFDALTSERPYKKAWSLEKAAEHLKTQSGAHFDPACVEVFFAHWTEVLAIRHRFKDED
ncbi:HD domain-containing phosphohydrolase [Roseateles sp.]|uniref:HD domain-containing phosphohydrolase n=1 Tax=Roseateles sp. TaxID=1971397 RepID=UPI003BA7E886